MPVTDQEEDPLNPDSSSLLARFSEMQRQMKAEIIPQADDLKQRAPSSEKGYPLLQGRYGLLTVLDRIKGKLGGAIGALLFLMALVALSRLLQDIKLHDVVDHLRQLSAGAVFASVSLAAISYVALSGYDWGALRYVNAQVSFSRILFTSFIAYAISNNLSFALVSGGSVRFRFYRLAGVSALDIAKIAVFCASTFTVGITLMGASGLLLEPHAVAAIVHIRPYWIRTCGIVALSATIAVLIAASLLRGQITVGASQFKVPSPLLLFGQILVSAFDLVSAAACLYVLLPDKGGIPFAGFMAVYSAGLAAGILSHVPGGLGVFETVLVLGLAPKMPGAAILGAIFLYRVIYYLLPLAVALVLFGVHEIGRQRRRMRRLALRRAHQRAKAEKSEE